MDGFEALETNRLILKNLDYEDRDFLFSQFSDESVNRYLFDAEPFATIEEADAIIGFYTQPEPRRQHRWVVVRKSDGEKIGTCGFHFWNQEESLCEVGYDLKEAYWGKGYMREAMEAILAFGTQQMSLTRIHACIYPENERSVRLAEKLGFKYLGENQMLMFRGKEYAHKIYTLECQ